MRLRRACGVSIFFGRLRAEHGSQPVVNAGFVRCDVQRCLLVAILLGDDDENRSIEFKGLLGDILWWRYA